MKSSKTQSNQNYPFIWNKKSNEIKLFFQTQVATDWLDICGLYSIFTVLSSMIARMLSKNYRASVAKKLSFSS